jgi:lipoyl(octanoyl) transferase
MANAILSPGYSVMAFPGIQHEWHSTGDNFLEAYLLSVISLDDLVRLQARFAYDISGGGNAAVIVCEHPPGISIGRTGSMAHIRLSPEELAHRNWPTLWLSRGGGTLLHLPGQISCYPILNLAKYRKTPGEYINQLNLLALALVQQLGIAAELRSGHPGVWVGRRQVIHLGVAIRNGITAFGITVNVNPDLELFRGIYCDGESPLMTSLQRESPTLIRIQTVRQRLLELLTEFFNFSRISVFHQSPYCPLTPKRHASAIPHR